MKNTFIEQVRLLVRLLAYVAQEPRFALKGGTAINLFLRDMPRLSVDIDLTYVRIEDRTTSLAQINEALSLVASRLERELSNIAVRSITLPKSTAVTKLIISGQAGTVKLEVSPILRGAVYPTRRGRIAESAEETFGFAEANLLSSADIFAGKLCAALDRQHPRDLFDVAYILESGMMDDQLKIAFLVYVISHNRPIAELLSPRAKPLDRQFVEQFNGMTRDPVTVESLLATREHLFAWVPKWLTDTDREFLLSFKKGAPKWDHLNLPIVRRLPAVLWKQHNLNRMSQVARKAAIQRLDRTLSR